MEFAYVFSAIFLSVFGLAMLLGILFRTLLAGARSVFDITVDIGSDISGADDFVRLVRKSGCAGVITLIVNEDSEKEAEIIARKYDAVRVAHR
ncbi:MAG: hypothetical protein ACI4KM_12570 [Oscillospiraceae bacterium]